MPTYVVEHRYKDETKSFKKIKSVEARSKSLTSANVILWQKLVGISSISLLCPIDVAFTRTSCVPEEVRKAEVSVELDIFEKAVTTVNKVKSPFTRGIVGPGKVGEPLDEDEDEQKKYCAVSFAPIVGQRHSPCQPL